MMKDITFAYPWVLYGLLLLPILFIVRLYLRKRWKPAVSYSRTEMLKGRAKTFREIFSGTPVLFRLIGIGCIIVALARPQSFSSGQNVYSEGIDIAIVLDISGSMLAEDFKPNRLEAAKALTSEFIDNRISDRIGLVIFSREAFTQCPLTVDYPVIKNLMKDVKSGMLSDGTAIGNALANGVNRLRESKAKSKVLILLTDGVNNAGEVDPGTAAEIAKTYGIRVYTIGIGTMGEAPYPVQTAFGIQYQMMPVQIDEELLKKISKETDGKYFRATGNKKLQSIYDEIDKLEKTRVEVTSYKSKSEHFFPFLAAGLGFLLLEFLLSMTFFRRIP